MTRMGRLWPAVLLAGCTGAGTQSTASYACLLPSEHRMLVAELFFGTSIPGRTPLTDDEWRRFAAEVLTPNFPDGFTAFDASGQWREPTTGRIGREATKVVIAAAPRSPDLGARVQAVIDGYRSRFHQQSVGVVTRNSCAAF